jgi:threonine/homoserine/homoserine lactone efflux protein
MIFRGFKFGSLLHLAVGPVSLFVFQTSSSSGMLSGETAVLGVLLADSAYILLAILGIGALLEKYPKARTYLNIVGGTVLAFFGLAKLLALLGVSIVPSLSLAGTVAPSQAFLYALLVTLSSPMTIVFWAGAFSAQLAQNGLARRDMYLFGIGAALSTAVFATLVAAIGAVSGAFLPGWAIEALGGLVGALLIFFGVRTALTFLLTKKEK